MVKYIAEYISHAFMPAFYYLVANLDYGGEEAREGA
jgi:hypothetical protein